jgi:ribonuclease-3
MSSKQFFATSLVFFLGSQLAFAISPEWAQRENKRTEFKVLQIHGNQRFKEFVVELEVNGEPIAQGKGPTKKKAEQEAAKNASDQLQIIL